MLDNTDIDEVFERIDNKTNFHIEHVFEDQRVDPNKRDKSMNERFYLRSDTNNYLLMPILDYSSLFETLFEVA